MLATTTGLRKGLEVPSAADGQDTVPLSVEPAPCEHGQRVSFKRAPSGFRATPAPKSDRLLAYGRRCGNPALAAQPKQDGLRETRRGSTCALSWLLDCRLIWSLDGRASLHSAPPSRHHDCGSVRRRRRTCRISSATRCARTSTGTWNGRPDAGVGREVSRRRHRGVGGAARHRARLCHRAEGGATNRRAHPDKARRRRERAGKRRVQP